MQTAALLFHNDGGEDPPRKYEYTEAPQESYSHTLLTPNRCMQSWRMNVVVEEWEGEPVSNAQTSLEKLIKEGFPDLYASQFKVADKTSESMESINWRRNDGNIQVAAPYLVDVATNPFVPQVFWCKGNRTLYFVNTYPQEVGGGWDGQTITRVWRDADVFNSPRDNRPLWADDEMLSAERAVIDKSFADVRPRSCAAWFWGMAKMTSIEGLENLNTSGATTLRWMFSDGIML